MPWDPLKRREKAIDFAGETSKLLITLATAFVAFTVTFTDKLGGLVVDRQFGRELLVAVWTGFTVSVGCGIWVQLALTQELEPKAGSGAEVPDPSIWSWPVIVAYRWQVGTFLLATLLGSFFGMWRIYQPLPQSSTKKDTSELNLTFARLDPFLPSSSSDPHGRMVSAVCEAREKMKDLHVSFAFVVGRYDRREMLPKVAARFGSNVALAQQRADEVGKMLSDAKLCSASAIQQVIPFVAGPRNTFVQSYPTRQAIETALAEDRQVEIYGVRLESVPASGPK